jgi:hypothetical protein
LESVLTGPVDLCNFLGPKVLKNIAKLFDSQTGAKLFAPSVAQQKNVHMDVFLTVLLLGIDLYEVSAGFPFSHSFAVRKYRRTFSIPNVSQTIGPLQLH